MIKKKTRMIRKAPAFIAIIVQGFGWPFKQGEKRGYSEQVCKYNKIAYSILSRVVHMESNYESYPQE